MDAYIRGLTENIEGEVTSSKPANLNEVVRMDHKLMEQKSQARYERILEGKKQKWESFKCLQDHFLCVNVVLLAMLANVRSSATSVERSGTKQGHTRNRCPRKVKDPKVVTARKYIERGYHLFLAHVTEKKSKEKRLEDVPVIRDFPEVFPDDLPGLPPPRKVAIF
ncbi:hypothetical protein Tco_0499073 [Tanacetum coccineum]